jgi:hypothetical protein
VITALPGLTVDIIPAAMMAADIMAAGMTTVVTGTITMAVIMAVLPIPARDIPGIPMAVITGQTTVIITIPALAPANPILVVIIIPVAAIRRLQEAIITAAPEEERTMATMEAAMVVAVREEQEGPEIYKLRIFKRKRTQK